jgi:hypothetical protein
MRRRKGDSNNGNSSNNNRVGRAMGAAVGGREEGEHPNRKCFPGQRRTGISKPMRKSLQGTGQTATFPSKFLENG